MTQPCFNVADFGAVADGRDAQVLASWSTGERRLGVGSATCAVTIAAGSCHLAISGPGANAGRAFSHADVGLPIHIPGAGPDGGGLITTLAEVVDSVTALLAAPAARDLANAETRLTWPCFLPSDVGKTLWIEGGGAFNPRAAQTPPGQRRHYLNYGVPLPLTARIASVEAPDSVTLDFGLFAPGGTDLPQRIVWGTDNTAAILRAGLAAIAAGAGDLHFPRGLVCGFGVVQDFATIEAPYPGIGRVFGLLRWLGDDADTFLTDRGGNVLFLKPSPRTPRPFAPPPRGVVGRVHLPRLAAARKPVVVFAGDSMTTAEVWNNSPHSAANSPVAAVIAAIQEQNPDKSCWFVDRSIGGAMWDWLADRPGVFTDWYADRARPWLDYVRAVPNAEGAAVTPDVVVLGIGGGNDGTGVSMSAMEAVIAAVRGFPADAAGRCPDIILVNSRPKARWGQSGGAGGGTPNGAFWIFQAGREVPGVLHRSYAASHGVGFLDYEDVGQRVLWGWSFARASLRRVPDTDAQACSRASPLSLRRNCRDFSLYLALPGRNGAEAWQSVGALAVQIGSRPDNVAVLGTDAAGRLTLQVNAWGGGATASVDMAAGGTVLATGDHAATDETFRWYLPHGCNVLNGHEGKWPFTQADVGKPILVPGAGYGGQPLRSFIRAVSSSPNALYLNDTAITHARVSGNRLRYGGMLFVPSDAAARVDVVVAGAGPDGGDLAARVVEYLGPTRVVLDRPAALAVGGAPRTVFVGRISMPRVSLPVPVIADPSPNPRLQVYVKGTQLYVGVLTAAMTGQAPAWRGPCVRFGGPFTPQITPATDQPVTLRATNCYVDEILMEGQVLTDHEMWGTSDPFYASPWDGNGVNHLTHRQFAAVDLALLRMQDFSTR